MSLLREFVEMRKNIIAVFLVSGALLNSSACQNEEAKDVKTGNTAIEYDKKGDDENARSFLEKEAASGNIEAFYYLGEIYRQGQGVEKNNPVACANYIQSAKGGYKKAFLLTGSCFVMGEGVQQDFRQALKWFEKASDDMHETAPDVSDQVYLAHTLADFYAKGLGTLQDFSKSAKWAKKAGELGDARSQAMYAFYLYSGQGVLQDKTEAAVWAEKSALQGDSWGQLVMGMLAQYGGSNEPDIRKAIKWYEKSAGQDNPAALYQMGTLYEKGEGVPANLKQAQYYYEQAAKSKMEIPVKAFLEFEAKQKNRNEWPH